MAQWLNSVHSDGTGFFVSNPLPKKGEEITISLRLLDTAPVTAVFLRGKQNGVEVLREMKESHVSNGLKYFSLPIVIFEDVYHYHFYIVTDEVIYYLNQWGIQTHIPNETYDFRILTDYQQPEWVKGSVFYQIFPDRFYNGNPDNDVKTGEYTFNGNPTKKVENWDAKPDTYGKSFCMDFYGGDLEGIIEKIPYLKKLGVTALYLNPIFYAATVHKYDCLDYFAVDPHFGGDKALADLTEALHKESMKLILDVSINHTGTAHKWFNKDGEFFPKTQGAYNNPDAKEREFYFFGDDNSYKAWFDVKTLPTLNYTSEELRDILYRSRYSLVKKWLKPPYNIDGWRFDVADTMARHDLIQLHHEVWPEIRKSVKEENPSAYILGEDWTDVEEFLGGDEWDSSMNYFGCARPLREFAGDEDLFLARNPKLRNKKYKPTAKHVADRIRSHLCKLPEAIRQNQFNLLDSHDVPRLHNNKNVDPRHVRGAVIMMFCLPGAPNIYYGDEAGIDGFTEAVEGCRFPMPWSRDFEKGPAYELYSKLANLKKASKTLSDGGFIILSDDDYVFSVARFTDEELIVAIFSTDDEGREVIVPLCNFGMNTSKATEIFGADECEISGSEARIKVSPHGSYLYVFKN